MILGPPSVRQRGPIPQSLTKTLRGGLIPVFFGSRFARCDATIERRENQHGTPTAQNLPSSVASISTAFPVICKGDSVKYLSTLLMLTLCGTLLLDRVPIASATQIQRAIQRMLGGRNDEPAEKQRVKDIPDVSIAQKEEVLEKVGAAMPAMIELSFEEGKMTTNIPTEYQQADQLRDSIGQAAESWGGSSSVSGQNRYTCQLQSQHLKGLIQREENATFELEETDGQRRCLRILESKEGVRVSISNQEDYFLLLLDRGEAGLVVQESDGDFFFNGQFANFNDFCLRHSEYSNQRLLPILRRFGVKVPDTAYSPAILEIISQVMLYQAQRSQADERMLAERMTAERFEDREQSIREFEDQFPANRIQVLALILDAQQAAEFRYRLAELVRRKEPAIYAIVNSIILPQNLTHNLRFLVWGLNREEEKDPALQNHLLVECLRQRLANLTQQPSDLPMPRWNELALELDQLSDSDQWVIAPEQIYHDSGKLNSLKGKLGKILPLTSDGKYLKVDRQRWKEPFNQQTPIQHFEAVQKQMADRGLPSDWLQAPNEYNLSEDTYALVLFDRLSTEFPIDPHYHHSHYGGRLGRNVLAFRGTDIQGELDLGKTTVRLDTSEMTLSFSEHGGDRRVVQWVDRPNQDFTITMRSEALGTYLRFRVETTGKTSLREFRGNHTTNRVSDNFADFQQQHADVYSQSVQALLNLFDLEI